MTDLKARIRAFIERNFVLDPGQQLQDADSLLDNQVIDSTGFLELIHFVEAEFDLAVADAEMVLENFESIDSIERFVARKRGTGGTE